MPSLLRLVDEVVRDAGAGERDDALGQEGEELVVATEGSRPVRARPSRACRRPGGRRSARPTPPLSSRRRGRRRGRAPRLCTWP